MRDLRRRRKNQPCVLCGEFCEDACSAMRASIRRSASRAAAVIDEPAHQILVRPRLLRNHPGRRGLDALSGRHRGRLLRNDQAVVDVEPQGVGNGLSVGYERVFQQPSGRRVRKQNMTEHDVHGESIMSDVLADYVLDAKRRGDTATAQRLQQLLDGLVTSGWAWLERNWPPDMNRMGWR